MRRLLPLTAAVLASVLVGILVAWLADPRTDEPPLPRGGDFTLTAADGPVAHERLRGRVVLLYFGYGSCPDVCPTSLALTTAALKTLEPAELVRVQVLFISVDPGRDTPEKLKQYAMASLLSQLPQMAGLSAGTQFHQAGGVSTHHHRGVQCYGHPGATRRADGGIPRHFAGGKEPVLHR